MFIQFTAFIQRTPAIDAEALKRKIVYFIKQQMCFYDHSVKTTIEEPTPGFQGATKIFGTIECSELQLSVEEVELKIKKFFLEEEWANVQEASNFSIQFEAKQVEPSKPEKTIAS